MASPASSLICGWGLLLLTGCVGQELKMTVPYGPEMCKSLVKRGCDVTFYRENTTCAFHRKKNATVDRTRAAQDIRCNKIPLFGFRRRTEVQGNVDEERAPRLLITGIDYYMVEVSCDTGQTQQLDPIPDLVAHVYCTEGRNVYFISKTGRFWSCTGNSITCKRIALFKMRINAIAVDDVNKNLVFAITRKQILQWRIRKTSAGSRSRQLRDMRGIVIVPNREIVLMRDKSKIYCMDYTLLKMKVVCATTSINALTYDALNDSLYFGQRNMLMKMSLRSCKLEGVMAVNEHIQNIAVRGHLALISQQGFQGFSALNITSKTILWVRRIHGSENVDFCLL